MEHDEIQQSESRDPTMISTERLSDLFVEVADTLVDEFDVIDFLHNLTIHAADISGAGAVGLMLTDQQGHLQFMAASNSSGEHLELFQLQNVEGPCMDCFATGQPVVNADLVNAVDRWPTFAPRAIELGYRAVHAFPMRLREHTIGALNLFGTTGVLFDPSEVRVVQALADVATIAILQEGKISRAEALTEQLQGALNSRVVIEQAKGAVSALVGIPPDEAFELLRGHARSSSKRLVDVAQAVLAAPTAPFPPTSL
jgi:GAF domain-containing protein